MKVMTGSTVDQSTPVQDKCKVVVKTPKGEEFD
jgi:hypothetical protein